MQHFKIEYKKNGEQWIFHCQAESKREAVEKFRQKNLLNVEITKISELELTQELEEALQYL